MNPTKTSADTLRDRLLGARDALPDLTPDDPKVLRLWQNLGALLNDIEEWEQAERLFTKVLVVHPGCRPAILGQIDALSRQGKTQDGLAAAQAAHEIFPNDFQVQQRLASHALAVKNYPVAIKGLEEMLAQSPDNKSVLLRLGQAQLKNGAAKAARTSLRKFVKNAPNNAQAWHDLISASEELNETEAATKDAKAALAALPNDDELFDRFLRLEESDRTADWASILELSENGLLHDAKNTRFLLAKFDALTSLNRHDEAMEWLGEVLFQGGTEPRVGVVLGNALLMADQAEKAQAAFTHVATEYPSHGAAHMGVVRAMEAKGEFELAANYLEQHEPISGAGRFALTPILMIKYLDLTTRVSTQHQASEVLDLIKPHLPDLDDHRLFLLLGNKEVGKGEGFCSDLLAEVFSRPRKQLRLSLKLLQLAVYDASGERSQKLCDLLLDTTATEDRDEFRVHAALLLQGPVQAYDVARGVLYRAKTPADAVLLARTAQDAGHAMLAARYLRLCARRWPRDSAIRETLITACIVCGAREFGKTFLNALYGSIPLNELRWLQFRLDALTGETCAALQYLETRGAVGCQRIDPNLRLNLAIANGDLELAKATIETSQISSFPHFRSTFLGQLVNELELYKRFANEGEEPSQNDIATYYEPARVTVGDWVKSGRGRLNARALANEPENKTIVQYWDRTDVPDAFTPIMRTWQNQDGWSYQLFNKSSALSWMRKNGGPQMVRAFRLARSPAEEADFFRLCYLAVEGGLYVDVDDMCVTSADALLEATDGAMVFQEIYGSIANTVMYAPRRHPLMAIAVRFARGALLSRSNETIWSKTGPGLMTRSVALYLTEQENSGSERLTILKERGLRKHVCRGMKVPYKQSKAYWAQSAKAPSAILSQLLDREISKASGH